MPSTYIAEPANLSSSPKIDPKTPPKERIDEAAMSPIANSSSPIRSELDRQQPDSPKTPEDAQRIPRDESFKTCKATAEPNHSTTPHPRRQGLRKTPARMSIFSGGKPYKEAPSSNGKKFNSRKKNNSKLNINNNTSQNHLANDTCNSNETFVKCEQELAFEHDSLEGPGSAPKRREAKQPLTQQQLYQQAEPLLESELEAQLKIDDDEEPAREEKEQRRASSPIKKQTVVSPVKTKKMSPRKKTPAQRQLARRSPKKPNVNNAMNESKQMPPPKFVMPKPRPAQQSREQILERNQRQQNKARRESQAIRNQFLTPKLPSFRKPPASLMGTASRYMNSFNTSRLGRSSSFKSTAELERAYINSLRSF